MDDLDHLPNESNTIPDVGNPQIILHRDEDAVVEDEVSADEFEEVQSLGTEPSDATKRDSAVDAPANSITNASAPEADDSHKHSTRRRIKSIGHGAKRKSKHILTSVKALSLIHI